MTNDRICLGVNVDHIAAIRQARGTDYPDPIAAAAAAIEGGADSITVHLREDRRHIQESDVEKLLAVLAVPLNLEMAATGPMIAYAEQVRPARCCLVPEKRQEKTTESGLELTGRVPAMTNVCRRLTRAGSRVSLFVDPDIRQIEAAAASGARVVELHTGPYADATTPETRKEALTALHAAAVQARELGLLVHAGHGLSAGNVADIVRLPGVSELNIGHSLVARAVFVGMTRAVAEIRAAIDQAGAGRCG